MSENEKEMQIIENEEQRADFNITFQLAILKLALKDEHFCTKLVRYLGKDADLKGTYIFESEELQIIFKLIVQAFEQFSSSPSRGHLEEAIKNYASGDEDKIDEIKDALEAIYETDIHDEKFYREYLGEFVQNQKLAKGLHKIVRLWQRDRSESFPLLRNIVDDIGRVSFEKDDILTFGDFESILAKGAEDTGKKIPTGIPQLDEDMVGGMPRESLGIVVGGTNVGKSIFCISLGCETLRAKSKITGESLGLKVLHINLEGERTEALKRYMANLAGVDLKKIAKGLVTEEELDRIREVEKEYGSRFRIRNMLGFGMTIEDLVAYCREEHKNFKFDMLIIDYGQLLKTTQKLDFRLMVAEVHRGIDSIAKELSCVALTPVQATRGAQAEQFGGAKTANELPTLRSTDVSECFEIARVSAFIFTLNRTDQEGKENKLRVFLEKQREGAKNITYGCIVNYAQCNLITGEFYDPYSIVEDATEKEDETTSELNNYIQGMDPKAKERDANIKKLNDLVQAYEKKASSLIKFEEQLSVLEQEPAEDQDEKKISKLKEKIIKAKSYLETIGEKASNAFPQIFPTINEMDIQKIEKELKESELEEDEKEEKEKLLKKYKLGIRGTLSEDIEEIE